MRLSPVAWTRVPLAILLQTPFLYPAVRRAAVMPCAVMDFFAPKLPMGWTRAQLATRLKTRFLLLVLLPVPAGLCVAIATTWSQARQTRQIRALLATNQSTQLPGRVLKLATVV